MVTFRPGVRPGRSSERKKSITRTGQDWTGQDRTGQQKSHKSVIYHILGGKLPVKILQWISHRGRCPRGSYVSRVWSLKFKGCKFYRGLKFGLLHWLCLWALTQCSATALPVMDLSAAFDCVDGPRDSAETIALQISCPWIRLRLDFIISIRAFSASFL